MFCIFFADLKESKSKAMWRPVTKTIKTALKL